MDMTDPFGTVVQPTNSAPAQSDPSSDPFGTVVSGQQQPNLSGIEAEKGSNYPSDWYTTYGPNAQLLQGAMTAPGIAKSIWNLGQAGIAKAGELLGARGAAEAAVPAQDALSAGLNAKGALSSELDAAKATKNALYAKIPQDVKINPENLQNTADDIINELKDVAKVDRPANITRMAAEYQNLKPGSYAALQATRQNLGDLAVNGEGAEKAYAARMLKALNTDIETASSSPVLTPPSQAKDFASQDLREMWVDAAQKQGSDMPITQSMPYTRPELFQGFKPALNNQDLGQSIKNANSYYQDLTSLQNHPVTQALQKARPEEMAAAVFKRGNVQDVNVAKAVLGQDGFKQLQGQFYNQILNSKNVGKTLAKYSPEFLDASLGGLRPLLETVGHAADIGNVLETTGRWATRGVAAGLGAGGAYELYKHL